MHIGFLVVVTHPLSCFRLFSRQVDAAWLSHDRNLLREIGFLLGYHYWIILLMFIIGGVRDKSAPTEVSVILLISIISLTL
jgi:hypothetical protein